MPPFFCLVHAELHRQCFSGLFYYLFDKSATYRRRILRIYPNLRRPCGSLWVLCRGFFRNQTADFYIFPPAATAKLSFSHVLILYMLPYGLFPERQRNENLKLPVLNIREELSAVFAADSLHVAHSVATASDSAPCALYKCHFNSLLRLEAHTPSVESERRSFWVPRPKAFAYPQSHYRVRLQAVRKAPHRILQSNPR